MPIPAADDPNRIARLEWMLERGEVSKEYVDRVKKEMSFTVEGTDEDLNALDKANEEIEEINEEDLDDGWDLTTDKNAKRKGK